MDRVVILHFSQCENYWISLPHLPMLRICEINGVRSTRSNCKVITRNISNFFGFFILWFWSTQMCLLKRSPHNVEIAKFYSHDIQTKNVMKSTSTLTSCNANWFHEISVNLYSSTLCTMYLKCTFKLPRENSRKQIV